MTGSATVLPSPEAARSHPALWAIYASEGSWQPFAWLKWLGEQIQDFLDGPDRFLAVSVPPGHGKSEFLSKYFPTWFIGANPGGRVIQASYAASLTLEWSKVSKELLSIHGHEVFGVEVSATAASEAWDAYRWDPKTKRSKRSGYLRAVGRGGACTGKRADLAIGDDLLKDDEEASSPTIRQKVWSWLMKVFLTRLTKSGKALLIGTRWHHDDHFGRIEDAQKAGRLLEWKVIRLPAIAEKNDPMGRKEGEALCPELFPIEELLRIKARDGHTFEALYQGRPTPEGGAIYKKSTFRYFRDFGETIDGPGGKPVAKDDLVMFGVGDLAVEEDERADYSALGTFGADLRRGNLYWFDNSREKMDGPALLSALKRQSRDGRIPLWVEKTAFHLHLIQIAISKGTPIRMLEADRDKVARAHPAAALLEAGRFFFLDGAPWLPEAEAELLRFPAGKDDVADVVAYAVRVFNEMLQAGPSTEVDDGGDQWGGGWWTGSRGRWS